MKIKFLKLKNWLLLTLSGLLGINLGCEKFFAAAYGCPEATYNVNGVVSTEKDQPIAGIGVIKTRNWDNGSGEWYYLDTTDAEGRYNLTFKYAFPREPLTLSFYDIDSTENGSYNDTIIEVNTENVQLTGGDGHWYEGTGTITQNVTLTEKSR